jgi:hypothetical protein
MKTHEILKSSLWAFALLLALGLLLFCSCAEENDSSEDMGPEVGLGHGGGIPNKLKRPDHPDSTLEIKFIVAGDPQFTDMGNTSERIARQRTVAHEIDSVENTDNFMGIVMVGDLVDSDEYYHLTAFRQAYEYDYPGEDHGCIWGDCWLLHTDTACTDMYKYYSGNAQVDTAVYPLLGNHDHDEDSFTWNYIPDRMYNSEALYDGKDDQGEIISNWYNPNLYAWEWGSYHFIAMGLWAFSKGFDDGVNQGKVDWLIDHLSKIDKDKPIIMFQHYGFDVAKKWWTDDDRDKLRNVICDSDDFKTSCNPYNVIALFTGHSHVFKKLDDILSGHGPRKIPNLIVDDAGFAGENSEKEKNQGAGFFYVKIKMNDDNTAATMTVDRRVLEGKGIDRDYHTSDCKEYINKYTGDDDPYTGDKWKIYWDREYKTIEFTPSLVRFRQGEPNNGGGNENCAVMMSWGRYNDYICTEKRHVLCYDEANEDWHISGGQYNWKMAFRMCEQSGWVFSDPKTIAEQLAVIERMEDDDISEVWVNYTDLLVEGKWQEGPEFLRYFAPGEPNNGEQFFERGWGQNCLAIMSDLSFHDFPCEDALKYYMCKKSSKSEDWTVFTSDPARDWLHGYALCGEDFEGLDPDDAKSFEGIFDVADDFFDAHSDAWAIWLPMSDLDSEGVWTDEKPWIADTGGWASDQPDGGNGQNCAILMSTGWHDAEYEQSTEEFWPFACRNYETGEWGIAGIIGATSSDWVQGFEACRTQLGIRYYFACPIRESDNNELDALRAQKNIARVWLNYTDAPSDSGDSLEGFWRHGYWKNWYPGQPDNGDGNENCIVSMAEKDGGLWADRDCNKEYPVLCRFDEHAEPGLWIGLGSRKYHDAHAECASHWGYKFSYPTCPSEQAEVNALSLELGDIPFWIQLNDIPMEGMFQPW